MTAPGWWGTCRRLPKRDLFTGFGGRAKRRRQLNDLRLCPTVWKEALAWQWLRHQPQSALAQWFNARFAGGGSRTRRIGIVALARKLLVALWRYLQHGELPAGARLKTA